MDDGLFAENTLIVEVQANRTVELLSKIIGKAIVARHDCCKASLVFI